MEKIKIAGLILLIVGLVIIILSVSISLTLAASAAGWATLYMLYMIPGIILGMILTIIGLTGLFAIKTKK